MAKLDSQNLTTCEQFANVLLPIAYLHPALDIPYAHYEKWDGTGYPRGLKGEQIPLAAKTLAQKGRYDAVICLGAVIRGATPHFDYVASNVASGIAHAARETKIPILFGVLTTDTIEQAVERAGAKAGNKGFDAAVAAIEMANLLRTLDAK